MISLSKYPQFDAIFPINEHKSSMNLSPHIRVSREEYLLGDSFGDSLASGKTLPPVAVTKVGCCTGIKS